MKDRRKQHQRWSTTKVLRQIRGLQSLSAKACQEIHPSLYGAAVRYFGSWKKAVEQAGFDYRGALVRRSPGYWSEELVTNEIKKLPQKKSSFVRQNHRALYSAAIRLFASWKQAVESAGFSYEDVRKTRV